MTESDDRLRSFTERQHGLITANQSHACGIGRHALTHRVSTGKLVWRTERVLELAGSPRTARQTLLCHVLDASERAALSCTTSLFHWGVRGFLPEPTHVVRHRDDGDHSVRGAVLHEVRFLPRSEIRVLDGIPVVSPALALLQLAGVHTCSDRRLARAIDAAWSDRLVSFGTLRAIDRLMSRQGRGGLVRFRALVDARGPSYVPPASNLEARFAEILERAGRAPMRRQVDSCDEAGWIGRVDFHDDGLPVVVEVQSERLHRGLVPEADDAERIGRLRRSGREVVEITEDDIFYRPHLVVAAIDGARHRARLRQAA